MEATLRKAGALEALPLVLILIGCPAVDFESDTVVHEDGSVERTARFEATNDDRPELRSAYAMLEGGAWKSQTDRRSLDDGETIEIHTDTYTVTARYPAGVKIPSDHVRTGETENRALRNVIELDVGRYFFLRTFDYREVYRDDVRRRLLHAFVEDSYPDWVEDVAAELGEQLDGVDAAEARRVVRELSDPWVEKFLDGVYIPGLGSNEGDDALVDAFWAALAPGDDGARAIIDSVFDDTLEKWIEREKLGEAIGAVYDDWIFGTYRFEQKLTMPGTIVATNADSVEGSVLTWEFEQDAFMLQDYALEARSRIVYPGRMVATVLVATLGFAAGARSGRRRSLKRDPERAAEEKGEDDR